MSEDVLEYALAMLVLTVIISAMVVTFMAASKRESVSEAACQALSKSEMVSGRCYVPQKSGAPCDKYIDGACYVETAISDRLKQAAERRLERR